MVSMLTRRTCCTAADEHPRLQLVELVLDLLARALRGAAHQQLPGHRRDPRLSDERLLVAERQPDDRRHRVAARLLRQEHHFRAARQRRTPEPRLDVGR